ncbi:hypothetical protein TcWFU_004754 [Taenia crassiceps]|uniref:Uncharacterized protein n=1 Tax=Taenia crassiceps TaxID=6207 RepID=A0ABR4QKJ4_9CEST
MAAAILFFALESFDPRRYRSISPHGMLLPEVLTFSNWLPKVASSNASQVMENMSTFLSKLFIPLPPPARSMLRKKTKCKHNTPVRLVNSMPAPGVTTEKPQPDPIGVNHTPQPFQQTTRERTPQIVTVLSIATFVTPISRNFMPLLTALESKTWSLLLIQPSNSLSETRTRSRYSWPHITEVSRVNHGQPLSQ